VPFAAGTTLPGADDTLHENPAMWSDTVAVCPVSVISTVRLFESGAGTITLRICLNQLEHATPGPTRFAMAHWLLRLTPNLDVNPESSVNTPTDDKTPWLTDAFLFVTGKGTTRLFDVMQSDLTRMLASFPTQDVTEIGSISADFSDLAFIPSPSTQPLVPIQQYTRPTWRETQVPFVFVVCVLERESFKRVIEGGSLASAKELATLYTKMTLDNRQAHTDFDRLSNDYLSHVLGFDSQTGRLPNLCLDEHVFFAFSRRGAISVSAAPHDLPAVFVIPSMLNLVEILRGRLFLGVRTGMRLAAIADRLASLDVELEGIDEAEYSRLRNIIIGNLQNPLQYLFDGGSVTEVAIAAERLLFVDEVWENTRRSFDAVDRLRTAWEAHRFRRRYGP
jgi:hypothetical protein